MLWEVKAGDDMVVGLVVAWTILFGLVLFRLATTVDELAITLTQRGRLQGDLAYQAHHDPLTQLANRLLFEVRLTEAVAHYTRDDRAHLPGFSTTSETIERHARARDG